MTVSRPVSGHDTPLRLERVYTGYSDVAHAATIWAGLLPGREQGQQRIHDCAGLFTRHEMAGVSHDVPRRRCRKEPHVTS